MDVSLALMYVLLGAVLGAVGQGTRAIVGIKKASDEAAEKGQEMKDWFNLSYLIFSLILGSIAGVLAAVGLLGSEITRELLFGLIIAGYAGADFIEGFAERFIPKTGAPPAP
ncbi:hypothetical protein J2T58_000350 [Methanocalculus alkaliphilus]|uniref:hypothetical protein n=1 Tax=Methanocalculus alkaliphilus TaxID=768730 RepID=UPI0020A06757|nr:hypothetical protein [Methanocalculus alkaliphilus]MCP1714510.1 hypothetical protein [Methanocalculus alkaliphilus]